MKSNKEVKGNGDSKNLLHVGSYDKGYQDGLKQRVTGYITKDYVAKKIKELKEIMKRYSSPNNGSWMFIDEKFDELLKGGEDGKRN